MPVAAIRFASPASVPADMPRYAALCYPTGAAVPGEVKRLECGLYLPSESVPADRRKVGIVRYAPGDTIPSDMRRIIPVRPGGSAGYAAAVTADTPALWLKLDETSGTSAADSSGNTNTGTYAGGFTLARPGPLAAEQDGTGGIGTLLNGTSGTVTVAYAASLNLGDVFTFETWFQLSSLTVSAAQHLYNRGANNDFRVQLNTDRTISLVKSGINTICSTTAIGDTLWHHLVFTKNGTAFHAYLNAVDVTVATGNQTIVNGSATQAIGSNGSGGSFFNGSLAHTLAYASALSAARVSAHYYAGVGR